MTKFSNVEKIEKKHLSFKFHPITEDIKMTSPGRLGVVKCERSGKVEIETGVYARFKLNASRESRIT